MTPDLFGGTQGVEHTFHDLLGTCSMRHVRSLRFEKLRMRQHDAELVIQLVK